MFERFSHRKKKNGGVYGAHPTNTPISIRFEGMNWQKLAIYNCPTNRSERKGRRVFIFSPRSRRALRFISMRPFLKLIRQYNLPDFERSLVRFQDQLTCLMDFGQMFVDVDLRQISLPL